MPQVPIRDGREARLAIAPRSAPGRPTMRALPFALLVIAAPAEAAGTPLPEPSNLALFGLGLAGLVIGRRMAARRKTPDKD